MVWCSYAYRKRFEDFIEKALLEHKTLNGPTYNKHHHEKYDRALSHSKEVYPL